MFMIICCYGRQYPINFALLAAFTFCEAYMIGGLTSRYSPNSVMSAGLATALVSVSLTIYAYKTKVKVEVFAALSFVVYFAMLPIGIFSFILFRSHVIYVLYNLMGVLLYSLYLIVDTMFICKGSSFGGYSVSFDDYIIGALMLYMDIVMLFVYLLRLFGDRR